MQNCDLTVAEKESHIAGKYTVASLVALAHERRIKDAHLKRMSQEIISIEQEVKRLRLESHWSSDKKECSEPKSTAEKQAMEVSRKIMEHPQLMEDVVKALRMKQADLQSNLAELEQRCKSMEEDV